MNREFGEFFPSNTFVASYCARQINDLRTIMAVIERFIEIAHKVKQGPDRQLAIDIAYKELHKSMACGLTLQTKTLEFCWDIFLTTRDKQHLPYLVNYIILRPDTCQDQIIHLLCDSLEYVYS